MTIQRYRAVLANCSFRIFWSDFSFSVLGDGMTRVALIWFVYSATGSARAFGTLLLCYTGPIIVGGLMAGVLLDRFDRRKVMIADNLTRGAVIALIPLLHALGRLAPRPVATAQGTGQAHNLGHAVRLLLGNRILLSTTAMPELAEGQTH
jgi:MFS family permease